MLPYDSYAFLLSKPFCILVIFVFVCRIAVVAPLSYGIVVATCVINVKGRVDPIPVHRPLYRYQSHVSCAHNTQPQGVDAMICQDESASLRMPQSLGNGSYCPI
jgi:hypothetical protein